ncbi:MAG: 4Fe-4S binding protein [Spirochaetes bacterium]|nr:4Fe-4S binding protein [Spirochaetota bacterium]
MTLRERFSMVFGGALSMFKGMAVTGHWLSHPKGIVTEQYPENRKTLAMHPNFRGEVVMPHDAAGEHKCTGCSLCEKACPNGSISVLNTRNLAGKKVLGKYLYRLDSCTLCALCVEACPFDAIRMGQNFELARYDRSGFELTLNQKEGR